MTRKLLPLIVLLSFLLTGFYAPEYPPTDVPLVLAAPDEKLDGGLIPIESGSSYNMNESAAAYSTSSGELLLMMGTSRMEPGAAMKAPSWLSGKNI